MPFFLSALGASVAVGFGCGSSCGSSASVFLFSYIVSSGRKKRENLYDVFSFYFGKCLVVMTLCILSSVTGSAIISSEMAENSSISKILPVFILIVSTGLFIKTLVTPTEHCQSCEKCKTVSAVTDLEKTENRSVWMLLAMGMVYGATPCAPLLLVIGYSALLSIPGATCLGLLFSISSCITPFLFIFGFGSYLSKKFKIQITEKQRKYFKVGIYFLLILMALFFVLC